MMVNKSSRIVLVSGRFNVVHAGHLRMFKSAKEFADQLFVLVESDDLAASAAYVSEDLRLEGVKCISYVDHAFIERDSVNSAILRIKPDIVLKGKEFENRVNAELEVIQSYGGELRFSSGDTLFSGFGFNTQSKIYNPISLPNAYMQRHNIQLKDLAERVKQNKRVNVIVLGDLIIDEYIDCMPIGMSQEDPTLVVSPIATERYIGGAGIVAAHAAGLGARVELITIVGNDSSREYAENQLTKYGVNHCLIIDELRPTTLKQRYRAKGKTLLRLNRYRENSISKYFQNLILEEIDKKLAETSVLVFSDFNYGVLPTELIREIIIRCRTLGVYTVADSQSSSQLGDISRFRGVDLVTPTEREMRVCMKDRESGLIALAEAFCNQADVKNVFLKLGEDGMLVHSVDTSFGTFLTDQIPALNNSAIDVAGAGDSLLISSALSLATGNSIWESALIGSLAAAIQVSRIGNVPLTLDELSGELVD